MPARPRAVTRAIVAALIAAAAGLLLAAPEIYGIATWKWLLGLVGFLIFVGAGRRR